MCLFRKWYPELRAEPRAERGGPCRGHSLRARAVSSHRLKLGSPKQESRIWRLYILPCLHVKASSTLSPILSCHYRACHFRSCHFRPPNALHPPTHEEVTPFCYAILMHRCLLPPEAVITLPSVRCCSHNNLRCCHQPAVILLR